MLGMISVIFIGKVLIKDCTRNKEVFVISFDGHFIQKINELFRGMLFSS